MKKLLIAIGLIAMMVSCKTTNRIASTDDTSQTEQDTVRIANEELEYEIIIIEPGFNAWLKRRARPEGYYSKEFLEGRNQLYVAEWNRRVLQPSSYNPNLYELQINYDSRIDYGYDVNYKLYYYFIYFQLEYKQQLTGLTPRI